MKTTINIPDALLEEARQLATRERTTVTALVEEGLRRLLGERQSASSFQLRDASFGGEGLNPQLVGASWDVIRELVYEAELRRAGA